MGLHQLGMAGNAGHDGLDLVVDVEALEERFDGLLSVVADNDDRATDVGTGFEQLACTMGRSDAATAATSPAVLA